MNPWRTLSVTVCAFCVRLLLAWWYPFGTSPHQSHSLFVILHRKSWLLYMQLLSLPAFLQVDSLFCSCNKGTHPETPDSRLSVHVLIHTLFFVVFFCPSYWFLVDLSFYRSFFLTISSPASFCICFGCSETSDITTSAIKPITVLILLLLWRAVSPHLVLLYLFPPGIHKPF